MDTLKLSKDSWHYWFVNKTTDYIKELRYGGTADICSYTRAFIAGALKTLFLGTAALTLATLFISAITWWVSLLFGFKLWSFVVGFGHIGSLILAAAALIATIFALVATVEAIRGKLRQRRRVKGPTAAQEMYASWKDKTCKQIEFN